MCPWFLLGVCPWFLLMKPSTKWRWCCPPGSGANPRKDRTHRMHRALATTQTCSMLQSMAYAFSRRKLTRFCRQRAEYGFNFSSPCAQIAATISAVEDTHRLVNLRPADRAVAYGAGALGAGAAVPARQERHAGHALEADNARALLLGKSLRERVLEHLRAGG